MSRIFVTDDSILFLKAIKLTEASGLDRYHTIKEKMQKIQNRLCGSDGSCTGYFRVN